MPLGDPLDMTVGVSEQGHSSGPSGHHMQEEEPRIQLWDIPGRSLFGCLEDI